MNEIKVEQKSVKVWLVCEECDDNYYEPHPTGLVFTDEAKAKAYVDEVNRNPKLMLLLSLMEGELK